MEKILKVLKFTSVVLSVFISFLACDKDFNSLESDVFGKDNTNFNTENLSIPIAAYNKKLDSVQVNNLASNVFGVFIDPVYGQTIASIITQVTPTSFDPDFGDNTVIDSVVLRIPYFNKITGTDAQGNTTYSINDSLYGSANIKLSIYQNNYFLRDFNPDLGLSDPQNYYSNGNSTINNTDSFALTDNSTINFDDQKGALIYENPEFIPSQEAIKIKTGEGGEAVITRSVPALRVRLDNDIDLDNKTFWINTILGKEGESVLSNANNFRDYFRGLYFKAEPINGDGNMVLLNMVSSDANITIYYSKDSAVSGERSQGTYTLSFTGNRLNTFINNFSSIPLENGNKSLGDEKLYLKGNGSMAIVDLFSGIVDCDGTEESALNCFLNTFRKTDNEGNFIIENGNFLLKRLINEAQLIIFEDESMTTPSEAYHKYDRIYAYDIKNNIPAIDFSFDPSENTADPYNSKFVHLGQRITDEGVSKYKIRITEHLKNILIKDSTNTKLGLVLSSNVNYNSTAQILDSEDEVTAIPAASLLTPRGTILHGSHKNVPENRRMTLEIFLTKPNN